MRSAPDQVRFHRPSTLRGVELVSVAYQHRAFPTHSHGEYVIGVVLSGAETLDVGGTRHVVPSGSVLRLHPGEAHSNSSVGEETLRYGVFYLPAESVSPYLDGEAGERSLIFGSPVSHDPRLFRTLVEAYDAMSVPHAERLDQETAMMTLVRALVSRPREEPCLRATVSGASIGRARTYIDEHFREAFDLGMLSAVADLSVFHLARSFKKAVGLSPLAYRNQRRVSEARKLLLAGRSIADVAMEVGFADQSHLTRQFQRIVGVSPHRYTQQ